MMNLIALTHALRQWNRRAPTLGRAAPGALPPDDTARSLLERASARAGLNPHQAQELRLAARACLSVVR